MTDNKTATEEKVSLRAKVKISLLIINNHLVIISKIILFQNVSFVVYFY